MMIMKSRMWVKLIEASINKSSFSFLFILQKYRAAVLRKEFKLISGIINAEIFYTPIKLII